MGVLIYLMLFGRYPFDGNSTSVIVKVIMTKKPQYKSPNVNVSDLAISFIKLLLERDPNLRPTAAEGNLRHLYTCS